MCRVRGTIASWKDILYFAADSDKAMLTASATLTGNQLAAAGAVHLAVNLVTAAAGAYALAVITTVDLIRGITEKSIKALMGSVSEELREASLTSCRRMYLRFRV